ncbi:angiogenic factor with G patch and FHA domains 1 isoform X2 [Culex quinquefasciatus]|uniref:angiogenic factor with G patch and FHA domains 1 isoform X2 n=1 Tax=Culex quinquefasciatus TaxID=7176 RepID=UPI0018E3D8EF|nr:angiogenic factor with G patch and FHA domains 1 isoform X2 [Culex quinquefasciatus]
MPSKPPPAAPRSRLGTKLLRVTSLYDITAGQIHAYVRGLHCRIRQQAKTIRRLRRKVAGLVRLRKLKAAPTEQVPDGEDDDDVMKALEKAEQEARSAEPLDVKAFVDDIKKTAEDFDYQNRYIYEPTSGMYYDPETGYYYNAIYGLHYDGQRGCYLKYNQQTGEYDFYSQVMPEEQLEEKKPKVRQKVSHQIASPAVYYDSTDQTSLNSLVSAFTGLDLGRMRSNALDISRKYPPSLRIIVQETNVAALRRGSLFIVTCKGGSLGREGDHDVIIPDINVSKFHLKFSYDQKKATYRVLDLGSRNGTLLNGARMAPTMQESDPVPLAHGDVLELNGTRLLCHVHDGASTCAKCEPGLLMRGDEIGGAAASGGGGAEDGDKIVNPVSHREGLKLLQKRYGLEDEKYVDPPAQPGSTSDYTDRAAHRRKTKGSTNEHAKAQVASVDQHIPAENKGFRMLAKLGWSEGQTLGRNEDGLREPIPMVANVGTSGLGSQGGGVTPASTVDERKKAIWLRTQERYQACADVPEEKQKEKEQEQNKTEKASLSQQIDSGNKGFQLLAKLGWNEGETLGKNEDGLKEPIGLLTNVGTSGLGSKPLKKPGGGEQPVRGGREKTIWKKKQEKRKPVVQTVNLFEASDSE